jgi:hypothetical protein
MDKSLGSRLLHSCLDRIAEEDDARTDKDAKLARIGTGLARQYLEWLEQEAEVRPCTPTI